MYLQGTYRVHSRLGLAEVDRSDIAFGCSLRPLQEHVSAGLNEIAQLLIGLHKNDPVSSDHWVRPVMQLVGPKGAIVEELVG